MEPKRPMEQRLSEHVRLEEGLGDERVAHAAEERQQVGVGRRRPLRVGPAHDGLVNSFLAASREPQIAEQLVHAVTKSVSLARYVPVPHGLHELFPPSFWYCPDGQLVHEVPSELYLPSGQSVHVESTALPAVT